MAERWQQWMPFHIDKWRGSPTVQAMHPAAQMGYLNMLCSCWQSRDCCVPDDPIDLATESRLGDDLWAQYGPRILRKFVLVDGRWRNEVLFSEWQTAKAKFEQTTKARSEAGKIGNAKRWGRKCDDSDRKRIANGSQKIATGTGTGTGTKDKKPSREDREVDPRHTVFKEAFMQAFMGHNQIEATWNGREAKALRVFLESSPLITSEHWQTILKHRFASEGANGDALSTWIANAKKWYKAPLDRFGQPKQAAERKSGVIDPSKVYG